MGPGHHERRSHDDVRRGTTSPFATIDVRAGGVIGRCGKQHRRREFVSFLEEVDEAVRATLDVDVTVHLVMSNDATIAECLAECRRSSDLDHETATADAIFRKLGEPCARSPDSGHEGVWGVGRHAGSV